jgi:RHS repeat-associated protein
MRPSTFILHNSSNRAYAFGSTVKERTASFTQKYRFGFNNQEQEIELGEYYSFEYRVHDARLGRFLSVDPWANKYYYQSTYVFAFNNPILKIDWKGLGDPLVGDTRCNGNTTEIYTGADGWKPLHESLSAEVESKIGGFRKMIKAYEKKDDEGNYELDYNLSTEERQAKIQNILSKVSELTTSYVDKSNVIFSVHTTL